ncbi:low temperature requirement protein A [Streptomyces sp. NPDC051940]|uniref:low temperature requirement protein A n=1 Tax=Streptomyces sp. NPDC051940 TaxID=3155675 RepID=UPI00344930AA
MTDLKDAAPAAESAGERHASWLELFFDLVAVAGVAQLAHLLSGDPGKRDIGLYLVLYLAFWIAWVCFTMYGNVAGEKARTRTLLAGMFGLAVMAAAVHGVQLGEREQVFAVAYVVLRVVASVSWRRSGQMLADWPVVSMSAGILPWIASIWVDGQARYWLWLAGVLLDLWITFTTTGARLGEHLQRQLERDAARRAEYDRRLERLSAEQRERHEERVRRRRERSASAPGLSDGLPQLSVAYAEPAHLGERLGLFVIIVLGEGVTQLVAAAADAQWDAALYGLGIGGFVLLVYLWSASLRHGYGGVPHLAPGALPPRIELALHCFTTGTLAALAAALGAAVEHAEGLLPERMRWLMVTSLAAYLLIGVLAGSVSTPGRWARYALSAAPGLVICLLAGLLGATWLPFALVWLLVLAVFLSQLHRRGDHGGEPEPA